MQMIIVTLFLFCRHRKLALVAAPTYIAVFLALGILVVFSPFWTKHSFVPIYRIYLFYFILFYFLKSDTLIPKDQGIIGKTKWSIQRRI